MSEPAPPWDPAAVRRWLDARIAAARADQVAAQRAGRGCEDECDAAAAQELVCTALRGDEATASQATFAATLKTLLDRDEHVWRGVHDDRRFDRHVRSYIRKVARMAKANAGFDNVLRYQ